MEDDREQLEDVITHRLISQMESGENAMKPPERREPFSEREEDSGRDAYRERLLPSSVAKVEKSLAALGFFTPSSRRLRTGKVKKITFTREVDGKKVEVSAEIVPSALSGLPITADQDKYLALQELITGILQSDGKVTNPIRFKSADLIRLLKNDTDAGKHYREISEWLDVMTSTTIRSQGVVWSAGQKRFATDRFHVFDRSVSVGKELEDGTIADANYVWLSSWQLDNINHKYLVPIDLELYRELRNHIAKALVPLLQIWLFASHKAGSFEKRYEELCEILDVTQHRAPSLISRQLKPSLDELVRYGYLEKWRIEKTSDLKAYKVVLFHGPKFHRDRRKRIEQKKRGEPIIIAESQSTSDPQPPELGKLVPMFEPSNTSGGAGDHAAAETVPEIAGAAAGTPKLAPVDGTLLQALLDRGITEQATRELLADLKPDQPVLDQLEWGEHQVRMNHGKFSNPAGFYIHLIRENVMVPEDFETSRKRAVRREDELRRADSERQKANYKEYRDAEINRYIAEHQVEFQAAETDCTAQLLGQYGALAPSIIDGLAKIDARRQIAQKVGLPSLEEFTRTEAAKGEPLMP